LLNGFRECGIGLDLRAPDIILESLRGFSSYGICVCLGLRRSDICQDLRELSAGLGLDLRGYGFGLGLRGSCIGLGYSGLVLI